METIFWVAYNQAMAVIQRSHGLARLILSLKALIAKNVSGIRFNTTLKRL